MENRLENWAIDHLRALSGGCCFALGLMFGNHGRFQRMNCSRPMLIC